MITFLKNVLFAAMLAVACLPAIASAAPAPSTTCGAGDNTAKGQILQGAGQTGSDCAGSGVTSAVASAVNILSIVVGIVAVIMVIIAGLKYITSGGDSNGISSAKNTLTYALVGLAVAASAQLLVHFALTAATPGPCKANAHFANNDPRCVAPK